MDYQQNTTIVIPSRKVDDLLIECVGKTRELYPVVKMVLVLDELPTENIFDENVVVLKSEKKTMSAKRNQGVAIADTKYILFIDSDSYPRKNLCEKAIDFLEDNHIYAAVTGNQYVPDDDNFRKKCLRQLRFCKLFTYSEWCKVIDYEASEQDCCEFMTSDVLIRKDVFDKLSGMNEAIYLAEDNEFSERIIKNGYKIRFIPEVSVFHHEADFVPFMRKIFCMSYYYAREFAKKQSFKSLKEYFCIFFPLVAFVFSLCVYALALYFDEELLFLFNLPTLAFVVFVYFAAKLSEKLDYNFFKSFCFFIFSFISFCIVWIFGITCGLLKLPYFDVQKMYRHY